jgi:hypothetical protein
MRGELQISAADLSNRRPVADDKWSWSLTTLTNPEFGMIALFCAVGLWLTFHGLHFLSNSGGMVETLGQMQ